MPWNPFRSKAAAQPQGSVSQARAPAIGIDLGTTFTVASYVDGEEVKVIHNRAAGKDITPSVVHFGDGFTLVGAEAVKKRRDATLNTVYNTKRIIGRNHSDTFYRQRRWTFEIIRGSNGRACVRIDKVMYTPEHISSIILEEMKKIAKEALSVEPTDVVITVPANFTNAQREATIEAGRLAGLNVLQIVNEPTAAAIAYSAQKRNDNKKRRVLVFDLGGGTFDVSIVDIDGKCMTVIATDGLTTLGGNDFDERIYEEAFNRYNDMGIRIAGDQADWTLMEACESAKKALSKRNSTRLIHKHHKGAGFDLTYPVFVELCEDLFEKTISLTDKVLSEAAMKEDEIDEILLVGGATRMRRIREMITERFPTVTIRDDIDPELAVAKGAAILADFLSRKRSASVSDSSDSASSSSSTDDSFVFLYDVAPFQLGLRLDGDRCKRLITRNKRIPFTTYELCTNTVGNSIIQSFEILEGNDPVASNNDVIAKFDMKISPKPARKNLIKVILSIDDNGILAVSAIDMHTKNEVKVTIRSGDS